MNWSTQVLNAIESVHRFYDFAGHITNQINAAATGRGLVPSFRHTRAASSGELVTVPQWWLFWYESEEKTTIGDGKAKLAELRPEDGSDFNHALRVVVVCFWNDRTTDRQPPVLQPQILCGRGTVGFREWGNSHSYKDYFTELARKLNAIRQSWPDGGPNGVLGHMNINPGFVWAEPMALEAIETSDQVSTIAATTATHLSVALE